MEGKPDLSQPPFPALYMCVIIDARIGSRKEIVRDLKATNLFENMVEALSLDNGLQLVESHAVDACFIGPAVTTAKAAAFIQKAGACELSKHCAFIAIAAEDHARAAELLEAGSHQVIQRPYSKADLAECIVRGVVKANAGSSWAGILLDADDKKINLFTGEEIGRLPPKQTDSQRMGSAFLKATPRMKAMIAGIESGEFGLGPNGAPDERSAQALAELVESILGGTDLTHKTKGFHEFFESALTSWFLDVHEHGTKTANEELKIRLAGYTEEE